MQKRKNRSLCVTAAIVLAMLATGLTACGSIREGVETWESVREHISEAGNDAQNQNDFPKEAEGESLSEKEESPFHAVPYFRDDAGQDAWAEDGFLYSYWSGRLCRYDLLIGEETVLFDTGSEQKGAFFIREGQIYFLVDSPVSSLSGEDTRLYRIGTDGSDLTLLEDELGGQHEWGCTRYELECYEDILYLVDGGSLYDRQENLYFRLEKDGSVTPVEESETLYGTLPAGYEACSLGEMPSLPYQMRNYGYLFLQFKPKEEASGAICVYEPRTGALERLAIEPDEIETGSLFLTNDSLCYCEKDIESYGVQWYRLSLDNLHYSGKWMLFKSAGYMRKFFWDKDGCLFLEYHDSWRLYRADWGDATPREISWSKAQVFEDGSRIFADRQFAFYWDGKAIYYNGFGKNYWGETNDAGNCVIRETLYGKEESTSGKKRLFCTYGDREEGEQPEDICMLQTESIKLSRYPDGSGSLQEGSISREKIIFDTPQEDEEFYGKGAEAINAYLEKVYEEDKEWLLGLMERTGTNTYGNVETEIVYLDEQYVGICISYESYWTGTTQMWSVNSYFYVFDRITGERLAITDFVEQSPEEICDIIAPYIEQTNSFSEYTPRESILEQERFYLTEYGFGIHYNSYEFGSYEEGAQDFIIPYREFSGDKLPSEKTAYAPFN